jgi:hypothetical protein
MRRLHTDFETQRVQIQGFTSEQRTLREEHSKHLETLLRCVGSGENIVNVASERGSETIDRLSILSSRTIKEWRSNLDTDFDLGSSSYETQPSLGSNGDDEVSTCASDGEKIAVEGDIFTRAVPKHVEDNLERGIEKIKHEEYVRAIEYLRRALSQSEESQGNTSTRYKILEALSLAHWNRRQWKDLDGILDKMEEIVESEERRLEIWHDRVELYLAMGGKKKLDSADTLCRKTLQAMSNPPRRDEHELTCESLHLLSKIARAKGEPLQAEEWESSIDRGALGA